MEKINDVYDVIVCGLGVNGAIALKYLSEKNNLRVLGIEADVPGNEKSSSWGETRLLRYSAFEKPNYIPLIRDSERLWREIQRESVEILLQDTGLLHLLKINSEFTNFLHPIEPIDAEHKFPFLTVPSDYQAYFEPEAIVLFPEKIISRCIQDACKNGAHTLFHSSILKIQPTKDGIDVILKDKRYLGKKVLITLGGWTSMLFPEWQLPIDMYEYTSYWFPEDPAMRLTVPFLAWDGAELFYGFPNQGNGVKAASYQFGKKISNADERNMEHQFGLPEIQKTLRRFFPGIQTAPVSHHTYFLDMGPDENIILDKSPADDRVIFIAGGSGHGFKIAPVLAKAAIQALLTGSFPKNVAFMRLNAVR